jgi:ATP-binding cassette subfamily C protein LapB
VELMTGAPLEVARDSVLDEERAGVAPAGTPFADSVIWLGRRLATTLDCNAGLTRRDGRRVRAMFNAAVDSDEGRIAPRAATTLCETLRLKLSRWRREPSEADLPMIALVPGAGYRFVFAVGIDGAWICEGPQGRERLQDWPEGTMFAAVQRPAEVSPERTARGAFDAIMNVEKSWVVMAAIASTIASVLVLATSLYSMQVYDRVIGQGGVSTLIVLTVGTVIAIAIEFALKLARSAIVDKAVHRIDLEAAQNVFQRMLSTRLDQYPASVGTFAAQVRSYEGVRAYIVARKLYFFTDVPFALFFLAIIFLIGGPFVAAVPALAFVAAVAAGLRARRAIEKHSAQENLVGNQRYGLLVETIQGAEFLKASGGEWQMRARWNDLSRRTSDEMTQVRHLNEKAGYISGLVQQISYISMVATGAYLAATSNSLTVGAIIACSIISGRVLTPVNAIPGLLVQGANAKVALDSLEKLYASERDNDGIESPLVPDVIRGHIEVANLEFAWASQPTPLKLASLTIAPGERVAILGAVGSGKSTLLKLLAGLIKPERGHVLLDGLDLQHIASERRAELIGYLPQQARMISGTLRDNLTMGLPYVSDNEIVAALQATGLAGFLAGRPEGVQMRIAEGGGGLSGGQRQLVGLTRLLLARPSVWLVDEPTSAMDDGTEERCIAALRAAIQPGQTFVLVTHKLRLLELIDRLIVLTPQGIALDGPRDAVIERLRQGAGSPAAAPPQPATPAHPNDQTGAMA